MRDARPKLLVVGIDDTTKQELARSLGEAFEIVEAQPEDVGPSTATPELVVSTTRTLPSIAGSLVAELESDRAITLLNAISEGVCLASEEGDVLWSNEFFRSLDDDIADKVAASCHEASEWFVHLAKLKPGVQPSAPPGRPHTGPNEIREVACRFEFETADAQRFYDVMVTPVQLVGVTGANAERTTAPQVAAVVRDVTAQRRMRHKMNAIDAAGYDLVGVGADEIQDQSALQRLQTLESKIIAHMRGLLKFDHFAIFLVEERRNKLELVVSEGLPSEIGELNFFAEAEGSGITGYVAKTGKSYICQSTETDERYVPGLSGCVSSLTVPLRLNDRVIGVMAIESEQPNAFTEEDRQFAEMFSRHVAVGLHMLGLLVAERQVTSRSVSGHFRGELDEPLEDIEHEVGYLDEIRARDPDAAAHIDRIRKDVESIRRRVADVASGPQNLLGVEQALQNRQTDPLLEGRRILIADDALKIRRIIGDVLKNRGCEVTVCDGGGSAVDAIDRVGAGEDRAYDLIISDIQMPEHNGYEVFSAARRVSPDVPVVLMTGFGYDPHHSIVRASQEGLQAVLFKPFQLEQLIEVVRKVFDDTPAER
ncbi:MAG: response regulator [Planctomycetota bacterium]